MSMNRHALAVMVLVLLCQGTRAPAAGETSFTILPSAQTTHLERLCSRDVPGRVSSGWDPTPAQVAEAEARLSGFIMETRRPDRPLNEDYYRQYLGVVISGNRLIYVNLFPRSLVERREPAGRDHWRTNFVNVCDGGDAFWGVLFDPKTLRFLSPRFNGVA